VAEIGKLQLIPSNNDPLKMEFSEESKVPIPPPAYLKAKREKKYLISSTWWREWWDFTNFEENEVYTYDENPSFWVDFNQNQHKNIENKKFHQISLPNSVQVKINTDYGRPGKIINEKLLSSVELRRARTDISEYHDYVALDSKAWNYFQSWYGYDFWIFHLTLFDSLGEKICVEKN